MPEADQTPGDAERVTPAASRPPRTLDEILQSTEGLTFTEPHALPLPEQAPKPRRGYHATPVALDTELPAPERRSATTRIRHDVDWSFITKLIVTGVLQVIAIGVALVVWRHSRVASPQYPYHSNTDPTQWVMKSATPVYALWNLATVAVMAAPSLLLSSWDRLRQREWIGLAASIGTLTAVAVAFARFSGH